ncbi:hypothetical protein TRFO_40135 [Tritrichomonas foetus]|uniref:Transmembrane protein n=1 Tax=Tritrichomonas foetus TaxID=1144522 RepID=A0A1J4J2J0_9EUKA|nr:hypothetical protein TRFO_40135 [Tritrichomonas foetus]|eukprot:OHS93594.1 hypothetical protein TRFO_40135 [Tritrichomonas foetus]
MAFAGVSTITSFFSYFQNLGSMSDVPEVPLPEEVKNALTSISQFIAAIQRWIPVLPNFDVRAQLVIVSLFIPVLLNLLLVWAIFSTKTFFLQIIDVGACGTLTYFLADSIMHKKWPTLNLIIIGGTGFIILARLIYFFIWDKRPKQSKVKDLSSSICQHYMYEIQKRYEKCEDEEASKNMNNRNQHTSYNDEGIITLDEVNQMIKEFSKVAEIAPKKSGKVKIISHIIAAIVFFIGCLIFAKVIPIPGIEVLDRTTMIALASVCGVFCGFCLLFFYFDLTKFGQELLMKIKKLIKRYGLRLMMLILDMLYVPILQLFVKNLVPNEYACPYGQYLDITKPSVSSTILNYFIANEFVCSNCTIIEEECSYHCGENYLLRIQSSLNLEYIKDGFLVVGPILAYVFLFIIIGVPAMWLSLVFRNSQILLNVCVWGESNEKKWKGIVTRMKTTGIFFFQNYKYQSITWCIVLFSSKFLVVLITAMSNTISKYIMFLLPVFYGILFGYHCFSRPYLYAFNNFLDGFLYFVSFGFSVIVIASMLGAVIPANIMYPLSIVIICIPFLSIILLGIYRARAQKNIQKDPTIVDKKMKRKEKHYDSFEYDMSHSNDSFEEFDRDYDEDEYYSDYKSNHRKPRNSNDSSSKRGRNQQMKQENDGNITEEDDWTNYEKMKGKYGPVQKKKNNQQPTINENIECANQNTDEQQNEPVINSKNDDYSDDYSEYDYWSEMSDGEFDINEEIPDDLAYDINYKNISSIHDLIKILSDEEKSRKYFIQMKKNARGKGTFGNRFKGKYDPDIDFGKVTHKFKLDTLNIQNPYLKFTVNKLKMSSDVTKMYALVDTVIDGATIEVLFTTLRFLCMFGSAAFGWYLGSLFYRYNDVEYPTC